MVFNVLRSGNVTLALFYLLLSLPAVVICLSVHEASHGAAAYLLGDKTAKAAGRLTLSPKAHIDPWGFLSLLFLGFGWARPVPVNISNFKKRRSGMALTALAGPVSNMLLAFGSYVILIVIAAMFPRAGSFGTTVITFFQILAQLSIGLGVFNLIPVHPLDGSRVLGAFLPLAWSQKMQKYSAAALMIFIVLVWFGWLNIIIALVDNRLYALAYQLVRLFL